MKKLLFLVIISSMLYANSYSNFMFNSKEIEQFNSVDFSIVSGKARYSGIGKGEYRLDSVDIVALNEPNTYIAELRFKRSAYRHSEKIGILYDGDRLWIKHNSKTYQFTPEYHPKEPRNRLNNTLKRRYIDAKIDKMELRFEF